MELNIWRKNLVLRLNASKNLAGDNIPTVFLSVYDTESKVKLTMALTTTELGDLIYSMRTKNPIAIVHDPNKGNSNEGSVYKTLKTQLSDNKVFFLTIGQKSDSDTIKKSIALSPGERVTIERFAIIALESIILATEYKPENRV
ncbi:MAG: hypothetical protein ACP5LM_04240, partial [Thermoplasmata archaeon]